MGDFVLENWGNLASVAGLLVGVGVLLVARGARDAAEEARRVAQKRSLVEDLAEAADKIRQIGLLLRDKKWEIIQLRAQEVLALSRSAFARWGHYLSDASGNDLRTASRLLSSIAELAVESSVRDLTERETRQLFQAQLRASELISDVLGTARRSEERS